VYAGISQVQRGHGIVSFLSGFFRVVKLMALREAKILCREALSTGVQILSDIGSNLPGTKTKDIVADPVFKSAH
jgi:hypothetical protein